jgi:hypothetical protein
MIETNSTHRNIFFSTKQRDKTLFPSSSRFDVELPSALKNVHSIKIRNYKYIPETFISSNNYAIPYTVVSGGTTTDTYYLTKGDYTNGISSLLTAINNLFTAYDVEFTIDTNTQLIKFDFTAATVTGYILIPSCGVLKILGFTNGICLYRTGQAPSPIPDGYTGYSETNGALASEDYIEARETNLVVRITDLEAIVSFDAICDRSTAILLSSRCPLYTIEKGPDKPYPLLQIQSRIQKLRITLLNMDGEPYDFGGNEASFMFEFHCYKDYTFGTEEDHKKYHADMIHFA